MSSGRENYFKNYKLEQIPDHSKKGYKNVYIYIGDYYTWELSAPALKLHKWAFAGLELATPLLFLLSALQNVTLNKTAYIVLPAILSICAWIFEVIAVCFFCFLKFPLKEEDYQRIDSTFFITFPLRMLCMTMITAACITDTIRFPSEEPCVLVILGYLACAAIALVMYLLYRKLQQKKKVIPAK